MKTLRSLINIRKDTLRLVRSVCASDAQCSPDSIPDTLRPLRPLIHSRVHALTRTCTIRTSTATHTILLMHINTHTYNPTYTYTFTHPHTYTSAHVHVHTHTYRFPHRNSPHHHICLHHITFMPPALTPVATQEPWNHPGQVGGSSSFSCFPRCAEEVKAPGEDAGKTRAHYSVEFTFDTDARVAITLYYQATEEFQNGIARCAWEPTWKRTGHWVLLA